MNDYTIKLFGIILLIAFVSGCGVDQERKNLMTDQSKSVNPFVELERLLQNPVADGIFIKDIDHGTVAEKVGLQVGDVITSIEGKAITNLGEFVWPMQPADDKGDTRKIEVTRLDGSKHVFEIPPTLRDIDYFFVKKGVSAWSEKEDYEGGPDFTGLADGLETWHSNSFEGEAAGFQSHKITHRGDFIDVEIHFRLGGEMEGGESWTYFTKALMTLKKDKYLSTVKTEFWSDRPPNETYECAELGDDGVWQQLVRKPDGSETTSKVQAMVDSILPAYAVSILPLTMPFKEGIADVLLLP
ncbi:MAG TPA: PDZ domain-containing protein [Phycisphaerae bacterium]|nr:PDZ domain-containing protein [Phycisphaerae bacterium]